jgi:Eukaryotic translation initiation factor eIF2A
MGQFIVLAGLRSMHGSLDFVDTNDFVVMNSGEHYTASDVEWDPTGRYVVTGVSYWKQKVHQFYAVQNSLYNNNYLSGGQWLLAVVIPGQEDQEAQHRWFLSADVASSASHSDEHQAAEGNQEKPQEVHASIREQGSHALLKSF